MTNFEKAVRYICLFQTDDIETKAERYSTIEELVHSGEEIEKYAKKYEKMLDFLCS